MNHHVLPQLAAARNLNRALLSALTVLRGVSVWVPQCQLTPAEFEQMLNRTDDLIAKARARLEALETPADKPPPTRRS